MVFFWSEQLSLIYKQKNRQSLLYQTVAYKEILGDL